MKYRNRIKFATYDLGIWGAFILSTSIFRTKLARKLLLTFTENTHTKKKQRKKPARKAPKVMMVDIQKLCVILAGSANIKLSGIEVKT